MKNKPFFNEKEISILKECLWEYLNLEFTMVPPDHHDEWVSTCLQKLENVSVLTNFTQSDYSIMYVALCHWLDTYELDSLPYGVGALMSKVKPLTY